MVGLIGCLLSGEEVREMPYGRITCTKCKTPMQENEGYEFITSLGDGWFEWLENRNKLGVSLDTSGLSCECTDLEGAEQEVTYIDVKFTRVIDR